MRPWQSDSRPTARSDTTKDRFLTMYHVPDRARAPESFGRTTLELVMLLQAGLAIFGMFDPAPEERNGLLCDATVDGIQRWVAEIGEPWLGVEVSVGGLAAALCIILTLVWPWGTASCSCYSRRSASRIR